tara:strand:+ start:837 stop:1028 length:192 start_codon:yes stop_codon:yes gene_type:complete
MFIYEVFQVVPSTAPIFKGNVDSKVEKVAVVRASNSVKACYIARKSKMLGSFTNLYAHQKYSI